MTKTKRTSREPWRDAPAAWFVLLERARISGDAAGVAEAIRHLRRLGVEVTLHPDASTPAPTKSEAGNGGAR